VEVGARALAVAYPAGAATDPVVAAALEMVEARVAGAAARPGRIVALLAAKVLAGAATDPAAVTADPGKAGATFAPVVVEPVPAVPVVRAKAAMGLAAVPALAGAVAMQGMTMAGLVVEIPAAVLIQMERYLHLCYLGRRDLVEH
jgi:hypothetical protein